MKVYNLRCESMKNPLGISGIPPRLTWNLASDRRCLVQKSFCVTVWEEVLEKGILSKTKRYISGKVEQRQAALLLPKDLCRSRTRYFWTVEVTDNYGETSSAQEEAWFETGLLQETDWCARWIEPDQHPVYKEEIAAEDYMSGLQTFDHGKRRWIVDERGEDIPAEEAPAQSHRIREEILFPCPMLRRSFYISEKPVKARMYATAHGIYSAEINGRKVGDILLAPEASPYDDYLQVQTYDLAGLLQEGDNVLGVTLSDGWWAGRLGCSGESARYGDRLGLLLQLELLFEDGHTEILGSDQSFVSTCQGPRRYADLSIGEKYDASRERRGWSEPGYDDRDWTSVEEKEYPLGNLKGQNAQPMKYLEKLELAASYVSPKGEIILDFGQMIAGTAAMHLEGQAGDLVLLRYFQVPDREGNYYYETMGENSQMADTVVLDGEGKADYDPLFTLHGFRYVAVTSEKGSLTLTNARARLLAMDVDPTASIVTSNPKLNQLQENIQWTIRSNMLSVLTDNPDRERSGWTGDAQMVAPTVCYNVDAQAMFRRWLEYCRDEQGEEGEIPSIIPNWRLANVRITSSTAGWGDVVIHLPWHLYWKYGDLHILQENYPMMQKWFELERRRAADANPPWIGEITPERARDLEYLWNADWNWGDWMTPSACRDEKTGAVRIGAQCLCWLMGTYYYAYAAVLMEKIALLLKRQEEADRYHDTYEKIRRAAIHEFYDSGKILGSKYVGAQILALHMGFYRKGEKDKLLHRILEQLEQKGMDTGFSSSLVLPELLCENGNAEKMYEFLLEEEYPSWLYEVNQGATSVWESMAGIQPDGEIAMCSFIQPAYCTIGNWMMEGMAGISAKEPGFYTVRIRPYFTPRLQYVAASYQSEQGEIRCRWEEKGTIRILQVHIPANTKAEITLSGASWKEAKPEVTLSGASWKGARPEVTLSSAGRKEARTEASQSGRVEEAGKDLETSIRSSLWEFDGLENIRQEKEDILLSIGSGNYEFSWRVEC